MAGARPILSIVSLILLAGGIVLSIFVILSGAINSTPMNNVYFLEAQTNGINGNNVPNPAHWTYFALCGASSSGKNSDCGKVTAALPFHPSGKLNFNTEQGVPDDFTKHVKTYYYLSRISWAFYLIALFFAVCALFLSLAALLARLGAYLAGLTTACAMMAQLVAAALMTAWTVLARNAFNMNDQTASLGKYAYGFTWGAFAAYLIATVLFCAGGAASKGSSSSGGGKSYFGRKRSQKSARSNRGSFYDSEDGTAGRRGVKDEYD